MITAFHHPYPWFSPETMPHFKQIVEQTSDVIVTGHEHNPSIYLKKSEDIENHYFEGGVLNETSNPNSSEFAAILVDLSNKTQKRFRFKWKKTEYVPIEGYTPTELPFNRNSHLLKNTFQLTDASIRYINDLGANFSHPAKSTIYLNDIFILPTLKILTQHLSKNTEEERLRPENFHKFLIEHEKIIIFGDLDSGKTCLGKRSFSVLREKEFVPLIVDGQKLTNSHLTRDSFLRLSEQTFSNFYLDTEWNTYVQLNQSNKVIIVDNFDKLFLNPDGIEKLLTVLSGLFGKVILLGDTSLKIQELAALGRTKTFLADFSQLEILPFGHKQRLELIERWLLLGREDTYAPSEFASHSDQINRIITMIIGKDLVPSYPIYILALLQQVETSKQHTTASGSYGHLFDFLVTESLVKGNTTSIDLGILRGFLCNLAFNLHNSNVISLSDDDLEQFHNNHCRIYALSVPYSELKGYLLNCFILESVHGNYKFKYRYYYTYFLGRYLADHIEKEETKVTISGMCENLYREDYANTIIFVSYFSQSDFLISEIKKTCDGLFSNLNPCDLDKDTQFANDLAGGKGPKLQLGIESPKENRATVAESSDRIDEIFSSDQQSKVDTLSEVNKALKTIQVAGQILRTYQGSLNREGKLELTKRCTSLGMRTLTYFLGIFAGHKQEIIADLSTYLTEKCAISEMGAPRFQVRDHLNFIVGITPRSEATIVTASL